MSISQTFLNGQPATAADLSPLAFAGYAHFTAMQVRGGAVRGLDLHLARLRTASEELFGRALPEDQITAHLADALTSAPADVSLTCYITSRPGEFASAQAGADLDVLIKVNEPVTPRRRRCG